MLYSPNERYFRGADGYMHVLGPCSRTNRERLLAILKMLYKALAEADQSVDFATLLDTDLAILALAKEAVHLCNLKPEWLSADHYFTFLLPGDERPQGIIPEINGFSHKATGTVSQEEVDESYYTFLASLLIAGNDLEQVAKSLELYPADVLEGMMVKATELRDPGFAKNKAKQKAKQGLKDMLEKMDSESNG